MLGLYNLVGIVNTIHCIVYIVHYIVYIIERIHYAAYPMFTISDHAVSYTVTPVIIEESIVI